MVQGTKQKTKTYIYTFTIIVALVSIVVYSIANYTTNQQWVQLIHKLPGAKPIADANRTIFEIIESRHFQYEQHFIHTKDGYIIQLIRIINPFLAKTKSPSTLRPVLLHHGFQCDGTLWLIATDGKLNDQGKYQEFIVDQDVPEYLPTNESHGDDPVGNTLGFVLSTRGYDVWLANYRGSIYSSNHSTMNVESSDFWKFSIDEMIKNDLPAEIDYILSKSQHKHLGYIGHSQGNLMMFSLMTMDDRRQQLIRPFIAISPVFYQKDIQGYLTLFFPLRNLLRSFSFRFPLSPNVQSLMKAFCQNRLFHKICFWGYYGFVGTLPENLFWDRFPVYLSQVLKGSSSGNAAHLFQMMTDKEHGQPKHFDFGSETVHLNVYKQPDVPIYNTSLINSTNIALIYSNNDWLNNLVNIDLLKSNLKVKLLDDYLVPDKTYNHMDFLFAKNVGNTVNRRILKLLEKYGR